MPKVNSNNNSILSIHNRTMPSAMRNLKEQPFTSRNQLKEQEEQPQPPPPINKGLVWIHCNKCFEFFVKKQRQFVLLSCQHVLCVLCLKKYAIDGKRTCPFCNKTVTSLLIEDNMPGKFKKFFNPQPWQTISNLNDVVPFQLRQRDHFLKGCETATVFASKLRNENAKLREDLVKTTTRKKTLLNIEKKLDEQYEKLIKIKNQNLLKQSMNKENLYKQSLYKQTLNMPQSYHHQREKSTPTRSISSRISSYANFKPTDTSSRINRV